jgi:hypothetical protein
VVASAGSPRARERTCNAPSSSFSFSPALGYPPLLIVSDIGSIVLHTAFTATVPEVRVLTLDDLLDANKRRLLKWAFTDPERLRPGTTTEQTTAEAAARFEDLAQSLRTRGYEPAAVAHFLIRLLFCLFAEDTDLLPEQMLTKLFQAGQRNPATLPEMLTELFRAMANGGRFGYDRGPAGTCLTLTGIFASSQGVNSPWGSWSLTMTSAAPDLAAETTASCVERSGRTAGPKASPVTHLACFAWETLESARFSQIGGFLLSLIGNRLSAAPTHRHPTSAGVFFLNVRLQSGQDLPVPHR